MARCRPPCPAAFLALLALADGCLLRSSEPSRFFQPESPAALTAPVPNGAPTSEGVAVRLRSVVAGPFLRERIVWRTSSVEYGVYEQRRWRELPATYVERALGAALLATPGLRLTDDVHAPALVVEVIAFDEVLTPARVATVGVAVSLRNGERGRLLDRTFTAEAPIAEDDPVAMARAMGRALDDVAAQVARAVADSLAAAPTAGKPSLRGRQHGRTR